MDLDNLIRSRTQKKDCTPISDKELCDNMSESRHRW